MRRSHQSLDLKHIRTWELSVERGLARVLVFEDDAVLAPDFASQFARVMGDAAALAPGWLVYLGRGDNRVVAQARAKAALVDAGLLPATDALVFDREAAVRRLAWIETHRITRPADWMTRETDTAVGVRHYWLARPLVEQGSMNGRFDSVLDAKRQGRGRHFARWRFRLDGWWRRLRHAASLHR